MYLLLYRLNLFLCSKRYVNDFHIQIHSGLQVRICTHVRRASTFLLKKCAINVLTFYGEPNLFKCISLNFDLLAAFLRG